MNKSWQIFTDGGSRGNPGQAACAFSIQVDKEEIYSQNRLLGVMTNNEAEYWGIIDSVEHVLSQIDKPLFPSSITWYLDSKLVVEQVRGNWRVKEARLKPLVEKAQDLFSKLPCGFTIKHVFRDQNARADQLVNSCLESV